MEMFWSDWTSFMSQGGFVMWPLVVGAVSLWFAIGYRAMLLNRGRQLGTRELVRFFKEKPEEEPKGFVDTAVKKALGLRKQHAGNIRRYLDEELFSILEPLSKYRTLARTIVLVAPLAGLLGTVGGMIEMFESLGDQTFYSQSGGVANGISKALFTTQFGLVIAIPGMIIGRLLDRKEFRMREEIEQVKEYVNSSGGEI